MVDWSFENEFLDSGQNWKIYIWKQKIYTRPVLRVLKQKKRGFDCS